MGIPDPRRAARNLAIVCCAVLFSLLTVAFQVKELGMPYLDGGGQLERHRQVLQGTAIDPWQYRILSEYLAEGFLGLTRWLGLPHPVATGFLVFRILQNTVLFLLAILFYRRLGLSPYVALLGISLVMWGMTHSGYDSDLQFSTYADVIFYLLAGLAVLNGRPLWIAPITILAALNRETSLLIPLMTFAGRSSGRRETARRALFIAAGSLAAGLAIFFGLRFAYGQRTPGLTPPPGLDLLEHNLFRYESWVYLFATLGILPIMAIATMPRWPTVLRNLFWIIVPVWFLVHAFTGVIAETRLFLVPHCLIFVPGALLGIPGRNDRGAREVPTSAVPIS